MQRDLSALCEGRACLDRYTAPCCARQSSLLEHANRHRSREIDDHFLRSLRGDSAIECRVLSNAGKLHYFAPKLGDILVPHPDGTVRNVLADRARLIRAVNRARRIVHELRTTERVLRIAGFTGLALFRP